MGKRGEEERLKRRTKLHDFPLKPGTPFSVKLDFSGKNRL